MTVYDSSLALLFFFKQKTAYEIVPCDWSSDVCSSDLEMSRLSQGAQRPEVSQSQGNRDAFPESRDQTAENPWASVSAKKRGCVSRLLTRRFACSASTVTRIPESR